MKFLVTGSHGFIGNALCNELKNKGHFVFGIDDFSTGINSPDISFWNGDVRKDNWLKFFYFKEQSFSGIFHLADRPGVDTVDKDPSESYSLIVDSMQQVIKAAKVWKCPVVFTSTSEVYGSYDGKLLESEPFGPFDIDPCNTRIFYALGNAVAEKLLYENIKDSCGARIFNSIGQGQRASGGCVVPRFLSMGRYTVYGDGSPCRVFQDVRETVECLSKLMDYLIRKGGPLYAVNVASEKKPISILELANICVELFGGEIEYIDTPINRISDPLNRKPIIDKLRNLNCMSTIRYGLTNTLEWAACR
jgi:nucleoside-diphosphate-sugar epimerase